MVESDAYTERITRFRSRFGRGFYETVANGILEGIPRGRTNFLPV